MASEGPAQAPLDLWAPLGMGTPPPRGPDLAFQKTWCPGSDARCGSPGRCGGQRGAHRQHSSPGRRRGLGGGARGASRSPGASARKRAACTGRGLGGPHGWAAVAGRPALASLDDARVEKQTFPSISSFLGAEEAGTRTGASGWLKGVGARLRL